MIDSAKFTHVNGTVITLNDLTTGLPFSNFVMDVDIRSDENDRPQEHGIWPAQQYFGKRKISIEGSILGSDYGPFNTTVRNLMAAVLPDPDSGSAASGVLELQFTGMSEAVVIQCTVDGYPQIPLDATEGAYAKYQLNFKAFDPRFYGKVSSHVTTTVSTAPVGRTFAQTFNQTYAAVTFSGDQAVVNNAGNYPTWGQVFIYGPGDSPQLWKYNADGSISKVILNGLVLPTTTDYVYLDFRDRTALLNGVTNAYNYAVGSTWFHYAKGNNTVRTVWKSYQAGAHVDYYWQNAYML